MKVKPAAKIHPAQIKKIHIAQKELGIKDDHYRTILSSFNNQVGTPAKSCKELNYEQAEILLKTFKRMGWKEKRNGQIPKYEEYYNREFKFASPAQMRKIEGLWMKCSTRKTVDAMNRFINRITGKSHITFLLKKDVSTIIKAIESLD